jgi:hypothetical protein
MLQALEVQERNKIHAQTMFESRVMGCRVDVSDQAQLRDTPEAAKLGRVDEMLYARCDRHIHFWWNADQLLPIFERREFWNLLRE